MDPSVSTEVEGEPKERKKIHFAMPTTVPTNLDPRQVEMIRRRRPTPATLFRVADQSSPDDDQSTHQWVVGENGVLKPKRVNPNVYQPPSLKAVQKMAEAQMQHLGIYPPLEDPCEGEEDGDHWQGEEGEDTSPTKAADHQETATTEQSVKFSSVRETAKQIQAAPEEEEEEEEEEEGARIKETTVENSRGSN
ncbi:protein phosphatase 1 regulatory subunit 1B isoform X2 [Anarrhichthys ocellatus]|uniref:protein phosphatase 1 regulatory subunit 1B isoform X2 n=1 Tax=Anarrhichthys ocellatus TaxID=433405 RepID=UPI0012ED8435|nr:protein phosphatase 1 regulatory subunit 1B-like isoform X2 [Anarrhichthys ocellatus]